MSGKQNIARRALQTLALFAALVTSVATAQEKLLTSATTTSGCSLSMEIQIAMRKFSWTGECKNNLLEGNGVLSFESSQVQTKDGRNLEWQFKWVYSGLMRDGKPEGLWIVADKTSNGLIFNGYRNGFRAGSIYFGDVTGDSNRKNNYGNVKAWLDEWSKGNTAAPRHAYLMAGVNAYYDDRSKFFNGQFSAPGFVAAPIQSSSSAQGQSSSADDPKVFGRSARGG